MTGQTIDERELRRLMAVDAMLAYLLFDCLHEGNGCHYLHVILSDADTARESVPTLFDQALSYWSSSTSWGEMKARHADALFAYRADLQGEGGE